MVGIAKFVKYYSRPFSIFRLRKPRVLLDWFGFLKKAVLDPNNCKEDNLMNFRCGRLRRSSLEGGTFWLTRIVFLRSLGILYLVAFTVAANQNRSLFGRHGIHPADLYPKRSREALHQNKLRVFFRELKFVIFDANIVSKPLQQYAYLGLLLAGIVVVCGCANMVIMMLLWIFYLFIVHVEQQWYSFGWESLLLDMGFLAIFLCPVWRMHQVSVQSPPSHVIVWIYRLFAILMVIQDFINRQDTHCWPHHACINNNSYETQPVPTVMSYYLHQSPEGFRKIQSSTANFIEPVISIFALFPRPFRIWSGILQMLYQVARIVGSNYSGFQYWVAILPSIMYFDDKALVFLFSSSSTVSKVVEAQQSCKRTAGTRIAKGYWYYIFQFLPFVMFLYLSLPAVGNFLAFHLAGNSSLYLRGDSFGAAHKLTTFTRVLRERREIVLQGTRNSSITPDEKGGIWEEYQFNCKPGDTKRRPCLPSPYHYKLDWLMWQASIQTYQHNPWVINLAAKLLANDADTTSLIAYNPFINGAPPSFIRGELYLYRFTSRDSQEAREGHWWKRIKLGSYFPAVSWKQVHGYIEYHGWEARKLVEEIPPAILNESLSLYKKQEKRTS